MVTVGDYKTPTRGASANGDGGLAQVKCCYFGKRRLSCSSTEKQKKKSTTAEMSKNSTISALMQSQSSEMWLHTVPLIHLDITRQRTEYIWDGASLNCDDESGKSPERWTTNWPFGEWMGWNGRIGVFPIKFEFRDLR